MEQFLKQRGRCVALCLAWLAPAAATAGDGMFVTARGHRIETPAIDTLDCARMERVLAAIDATGYRKGKRLPYDGADMALLEYEHRLAEAHFDRCRDSGTPLAPTSDGDSRHEGVFGGGYD